MSRACCKAFSLVELLVVTSITTLLAIITITGLINFKERAQLTKCGQSLRSAGVDYYRAFHELDSIGVGQVSVISGPTTVLAAQGVPKCPWCDPGGGDPPAASPPEPQPSDRNSGALALNLSGSCPKARPNPMYALDAENQPPVRSFGVAEPVSRGRNWPWMLADSSFENITEPEELATDRHDGRISVFFKDGHVSAVQPDSLKFFDDAR